MLRDMESRGETVDAATWDRLASNCAAQLRRGFAAELADVFRGERPSGVGVNEGQVQCINIFGLPPVLSI
jgi:hypothetical protein